jgi:hypothetical protein
LWSGSRAVAVLVAMGLTAVGTGISRISERGLIQSSF